MEDRTSVVSILGLTVADVRRAMGLMPSVTTYDEYIQDTIRTKADLMIEDIFTLSELRDLTTNQKRRAVEGLALLLAADCLMLLPTNFALNSGDGSGLGGGQSVTLGPISVGAWNGSAGVSGLRSVSAQLRDRGLSILQDLRLLNSKGIIPWKAVGTTINPSYTGGRRQGIRRQNPSWMERGLSGNY